MVSLAMIADFMFVYFFFFFITFITTNTIMATARAPPQIAIGIQLMVTPVGGLPLLAPIVSAKQGMLITKESVTKLKNEIILFILLSFLSGFTFSIA